MKTLLRSCFIADPTDREPLALQNYHAMVESGLGFDQTEDNVVWQFIQDFFKGHGHIPTLQSIRTHYERVQEMDVVDRLERVALLKPRTRGDFLTYLENKASDRRTKIVLDLAKDMAKIASIGIEVKDGKTTIKLQGAIDAIRYALDKSHDIVAPTLGSKLSGNVMTDEEDFNSRYDKVKSDPMYGVGQWCGIAQIDNALNGAKRYELWLHTAWTGGLKSTWALHWAYIQAVYFGNSSIYFSLEMPYIQCRNLLYTMHSAHEDFREILAQLGIKGMGLDYEKIRDGQLNPNEEKFLKEYVVPSMNKAPTCDHKGSKYSLNPKDYGDIHIEVADPDKTEFTINDLRSRAELIFAKTPFKLIFLDHVGLMSARGRYGNTTDKLNEVIRDLKRLAMSFNRGMGIAVVGLFQISREGFRSAEKNGGRYNLTHLSYANEAERCVVTGTLVQTHRGFRPIEEVRVGDKVWSSTGWRKVRERFDNGVRRISVVTTDRGSRLESTASHRVRVVEDGQLGWCRVGDLTKGQYVVGTFGGNNWPKTEPQLPPLEFRKHESRKGRKGEGSLSTPARITAELAYLLGSWDGDGKIHSGGVAWTGNRKEKCLRAALESCFKTSFHQSLPGTTSPSRPGVFDLTKWSLPLKRWFETVAGARAGEVPAAVLGGSQGVVCAYLKGLFDTDGWVNRIGIIGINLKASCEPFLRDVQMLLTSLGIDSHLGFCTTYSKQTCKYHSKVTLRVRTREGRVRFNQLIGFTEPKRKRRVTSFIKKGKRSKRRGDIQVYPVPETALRVYRLVHPKGSKQTKYKRSFYNLPSRVRRTGTVPRELLVQLVDAATKSGYENPDLVFLRKLLSLHVMRVVSAEDTGRDEPVMDLEVGGDCEYQTGPILSHNSSDIVTAAYIDDDLRKLGRVIFQCLKSRDQAPFDRISVRVEFSCRRMLTDNTAIEEIDGKIQSNKGEYDKIKPIEHHIPDLID